MAIHFGQIGCSNLTILQDLEQVFANFSSQENSMDTVDTAKDSVTLVYRANMEIPEVEDGGNRGFQIKLTIVEEGNKNAFL